MLIAKGMNPGERTKELSTLSPVKTGKERSALAEWFDQNADQNRGVPRTWAGCRCHADAAENVIHPPFLKSCVSECSRLCEHAGGSEHEQSVTVIKCHAAIGQAGY